MHDPGCKNCPDRYVTEHSNCHATCESYQKWTKERKEQLEIRRKNNLLTSACYDMRRNLSRR